MAEGEVIQATIVPAEDFPFRKAEPIEERRDIMKQGEIEQLPQKIAGAAKTAFIAGTEQAELERKAATFKLAALTAAVGPNADARKASMEATLAGDEVYQRTLKEIQLRKDAVEIAKIDAQFFRESLKVAEILAQMGVKV